MMEINYRLGFRGKRYLAKAAWSEKGIKNVIIFHLNMMTKQIREALMGLQNNSFLTDEEVFETFFILNFARIDYHEFLHLYVRRKSGLKNTYIVTPQIENMCGTMDEILYWEIFGSRYHFDKPGDPIGNIIKTGEVSTNKNDDGTYTHTYKPIDGGDWDE